MRWSRFIFSTALLTCTLQVIAGDSIYVEDVPESKYDKRIHRYQRHWAALIPTEFVIQNAGNMGIASAGIGWDYGKRGQWETDLLLGYIPAHDSSRGKLTMTLKENYIPWSISFTPRSVSVKEKGRWSIEPLTASIYINTVYGHEFWKTQPSRYPDSYYDFMSTKFRLNIAFGQRLSFTIPEKKRRRLNKMTLFYEVSSCDLYIRSKIQDSSVPLKDIIGLSIGLRLQTL